MIKAQKEGVGLNTGTAGMGRPSLGGTKKEPPKGTRVTGSKREPVRDDRPTLSEAGISKKLSSRAQKLAAISEPEFGAGEV